MNVHEAKKIICISFMFGFLIGIVYLNIFARGYILSAGIFDNEFLKNFSGIELNTRKYTGYIIKVRLLPIGILAMFARAKYRRVVAALFLIWTGFSCGLIISASILKLGIKGVGLCIVAVMPQFVSYIIVYIMLFIYMFTYPGIRWNSTKTISIVLFTLLGIITEIYINPVLIDIFIKIL